MRLDRKGKSCERTRDHDIQSSTTLTHRSALQMSFTLRVFNPGTEPFSVPVDAAAAGITAENAMKAIEAHDGGVNIGFNVSTWLLFLASPASGEKLGENLAFGHYFCVATGGIVHVLVEPKTHTTNREL